MLIAIYIPKDDKLKNFRSSRKYLSFSYFILGLSGFVSSLSGQEATDWPLLATCTLLVASYQSLLFTYTALALIQPLYINRKSILLQLAGITALGGCLFLILFLFPGFWFYCAFYTALALYILQLACYTRLFRVKYKTFLTSLEEHFGEDMNTRMRWVRRFFYTALGVGIFTVVSLFGNLYFYVFFTILYTIYYVQVVCWFFNYQVVFGFGISFITQKTASVQPDEEKTTSQEEASFPAEQYEKLKSALEIWVEEKKFTEKDISIDEIANQLGTNRNFLRHYFSTNIGSDFRSWRLELRIREAQQIILAQPHLSTSQVSEMVGFGDRSNFHRQFIKTTGVSPANYKRLHSKNISQ